MVRFCLLMWLVASECSSELAGVVLTGMRVPWRDKTAGRGIRQGTSALCDHCGHR